MPIMLALLFGVLGLIFHAVASWLSMLLLGLLSGYVLGRTLERDRETEKLHSRLDEHRQKILELLQRADALGTSPTLSASDLAPAAPQTPTSIAAWPAPMPTDQASALAQSDPVQPPTALEEALAAAQSELDRQQTSAPPAESARSPVNEITDLAREHPALPPARDLSSTLPGPLQWLIQGNPVAKLGVLLLFFGLSYLFKFAADRAWFPIELRLGGAALLASALLAVGWRLRRKQPLFALLLQGASAGSLYLTIFAAFRVFDLIPQSLAFILMLIVCASSVILAILQRAQSLAVAASLGGFLAPLLLSSGQGNHVGLFSYYLLLSGGILAVSLFQSWRSLNLIGFFFTFGVASIWGLNAYRPSLYAECQLFLVAFLLIYGVVAILFALRQPTELKGFVDGTLVFGTPLLGFGLQYGLTRHWTFGPAFSALGFGALYLPLALWLLRRRPDAGRLLAQAFMALGIAFLTLAIPLGLDARWTALAWALEGAGLIWVGAAQQRRRMVWSGAALQLAASLAMLRFLSHAPTVIAGLTCGMVLAFAWLAAAFTLVRARAATEPQWPERTPLYYGLFAGGIGWWSLTLLWFAFELTHERIVDRSPIYLAAMSASALIWLGLGRRVAWPDLGRVVWLLWPAYALAWIIDGALHPLQAWSGLIWPVALAVGIWLLHRRRGEDAPSLQIGLHSTFFWLVGALAYVEILWQVDDFFLFADEWRALAYLAWPALLIGISLYAVRRRCWLFAVQKQAYVLFGPLPFIVALLLGLVYANTEDGWLRELGIYIPFLNPLELSALAALLGLLAWKRAASRHFERLHLTPRQSTALLAALAFWWGNGMLLRLLAEISDLTWNWPTLWHSRLVQTSLALAWTSTALATMWSAAKTSHRVRWLAGAGLLGAVVLKLFLVDSAASGGLARAVAFIGVALLLLLIGYVAPLPPRAAAKP